MDKSPLKIKNMFDEVAKYYDFMNNIMSFGIHKIIKKDCMAKLPVLNGSIIADICCGSGDLAIELAQNKNIEKIYAFDFSSNMLAVAKSRTIDKKIEYILADCYGLPLSNSYLDGCVMGFGLRNIENLEIVVTEINRILKNGAFFFHIDIFKTESFLSMLFDKFVIIMTKFFCKSSDAYSYLIKSKNNFMSSEELISFVEEYGFVCNMNKKYLGGLICAQLFKKVERGCE